jgi:hypothetical protein
MLVLDSGAVVPSIVLVECLEGHGGRDTAENRFLKSCDPRTGRARRGSAVDALVVAAAEPSGTVLTSDPRDLEALASHAQGVHIERI